MKFNSKKGSFFKESRQLIDNIDELSEYPGPGTYDIELNIMISDEYKGPKMSAKYKDDNTEMKNTPAPNHYKVIDNKNQKNITFSFSKQEKRSTFYGDNKVPGPTHYSLDTEFSKSGYVKP